VLLFFLSEVGVVLAGLEDCEESKRREDYEEI
jgi:hypothetical protein